MLFYWQCWYLYFLNGLGLLSIVLGQLLDLNAEHRDQSEARRRGCCIFHIISRMDDSKLCVRFKIRLFSSSC